MSGKRKLVVPNNLSPTVLIFSGRPDFDRIVREMVGGVEHGTGLPEDIVLAAEAAIGQAQEYGDSLTRPEALPACERFDVLIRRELKAHGEEGLLEHIRASLHPFPAVAPGVEPTNLSAQEFGLALDAIVEAGSFNEEERDELIERFDADQSGAVSIKELLEGCRAAISLATQQNVSIAALSARRQPLGSPKVDRKGWAMRKFAPPPKGGRAAPASTAPLPPLMAAAATSNEEGKEDKVDGEEAMSGTRGFEEESSAARNIQPEAFVEAVGTERLATWGMLYCGGSQPVVDALKQIEMLYGIGLAVEKFDW